MTKYWWSMGLAALAMGLLLFGVLHLINVANGATAAQCMTPEEDKRVHELTITAIDDAFKSQVAHLFTVWLKDPSPEPSRAMVGMTNAISAYHRARDNAEHWVNVICKE